MPGLVHKQRRGIDSGNGYACILNQALGILLDRGGYTGKWIVDRSAETQLLIHAAVSRHALGQNLAAYVRIPEEECMVELYADMEQLRPDHEPRIWPDNAHSSNTWGILPPRSYFRFDAEAVDWERQGLEALGHPLPA